MSADKPERYENDEGQRFYPIEELGRDLPSVTTVTGIIDKPALVNWSAKMAVEFIQKKVLDELEKGKLTIKDLRGADVRELVKQAKQYHNELKEAAGDRGTRVHKFIEEYVAAVLNPNPFSDEIEVEEDIAEQARRFITWWTEHDVHPKLQELKIWSKEGGGYAGRLDCYWQVDGKWYIVDIKTSKGLWPEHEMQLAGYVYAFMERFPEEPIHGAAFLHISELTGEAEFLTRDMAQVKDEYRKFLCLCYYVNVCLEIQAKAKAEAAPKKKAPAPAKPAESFEDL